MVRRLRVARHPGLARPRPGVPTPRCQSLSQIGRVTHSYILTIRGRIRVLAVSDDGAEGVPERSDLGVVEAAECRVFDDGASIGHRGAQGFALLGDDGN